MITFHLADSLPRHVLEMIARETEALPGGQGKAESQRRLQAWLDSGYGACHLRRSEIAAVVEARAMANADKAVLFIRRTPPIPWRFTSGC